MIVAENIHKFYENNHILKGINLRVDKGEIISLVGASGAGKTTLLQILALSIYPFSLVLNTMVN